MVGLKLNAIGEEIVRRGGANGVDDDGMLIHEIAHRAPGLDLDDLEAVFVAIMVEYGEDALFAIRNGYVQFEVERAGVRPAQGEGTDE